jgi:hypothetical protein
MRLLSLVGAPAILFAIRDWCGGRRFTVHVFRVIWGMPGKLSPLLAAKGDILVDNAQTIPTSRGRWNDGEH